MFPDISCDDIFRLETPHLWLRWLRASDATALAAICGTAEVAEATASIPHPYPAGEAERFILQARSATAGGDALVLAITTKGKARTFVGLASAQAAGRHEIDVGYLVASAHAGRGYATEALTALIDATFNLTEARALTADTRVENAASRRVLEKCGFVFGRTEIKHLPARGGAYACAFYRRERAGWVRGNGRVRRLPRMMQQPPRAAAED